MTFDGMMRTCQEVADLSKRRICLAKPRLYQTIERRLWAMFRKNSRSERRTLS